MGKGVQGGVAGCRTAAPNLQQAHTRHSGAAPPASCVLPNAAGACPFPSCHHLGACGLLSYARLCLLCWALHATGSAQLMRSPPPPTPYPLPPRPPPLPAASHSLLAPGVAASAGGVLAAAAGGPQAGRGRGAQKDEGHVPGVRGGACALPGGRQAEAVAPGLLPWLPMRQGEGAGHLTSSSGGSAVEKTRALT